MKKRTDMNHSKMRQKMRWDACLGVLGYKEMNRSLSTARTHTHTIREIPSL